MKNSLIQKILLLCLIFFMNSCRKGDKENMKDNREEIDIAFLDQTDSKALTLLCQQILQEKGYRVRSTVKPLNSIYEDLAAQRTDLFLTARMPYSHHVLLESNKDYINVSGESYSSVYSGLAVPDYININAITQLNTHLKKPGNIFYVVDNPASSSNVDKAIKRYKLEFSIKYIKTPELVDLLEKANSDKSWIVFYSDGPGNIWCNENLKFLRDPFDIFPDENYTILSSAGFKFDYPMISIFLGNFNVNEKDLLSIMKLIKNDNQDAERIARWRKKNKNVIESWFPDEWE